MTSSTPKKPTYSSKPIKQWATWKPYRPMHSTTARWMKWWLKTCSTMSYNCNNKPRVGPQLAPLLSCSLQMILDHCWLLSGLASENHSHFPSSNKLERQKKTEKQVEKLSKKTSCTAFSVTFYFWLLR